MASFVILPQKMVHGLKTVTTAGTQVALATANQLFAGVHIKAEDTNTGYIYVGDSDVASTNGFQLAAGEAVFIEVNQIATIWIDSSVNGDGVTYVGG